MLVSALDLTPSFESSMFDLSRAGQHWVCHRWIAARRDAAGVSEAHIRNSVSMMHHRCTAMHTELCVLGFVWNTLYALRLVVVISQAAPTLGLPPSTSFIHSEVYNPSPRLTPPPSLRILTRYVFRGISECMLVSVGVFWHLMQH